ncbi:MAG: dihydrolipoamide acetyltransferase family protein [Candidatus Caldatribacteriota bacterium]|nr:dihydrolipoamide acetyltransferase family protein [Candidatus Caldatribacteriota bacterium]
MYEIKMPRFGLTMETGFIEKWFKEEGEKVKEGEPLLEVSSEKITNEVASPTSGILLKIIGKEKEEIKVGTVIAIIGEEGEKVKKIKEKEESKKIIETTERGEISPAKVAPPERSGRIKASPLAKRIAREKNLDLSQIKGTGPDGRIEKKDVLAYLSSVSEKKKVEFKIEKLSGLRRTIAERLSKSFHTAVTLTNTTEVDFTKFKKLMKENNVSITSGLAFVSSKILIELNKFNAHFNSDKKELIIYNNVNIGIAVDTEKGLMVPVIKNTDKLNLRTINDQIKKFAGEARNGIISENNIKGSTFTLTNLGMMRTEIFTPVINPPEVAILGIGRIIKKPIIDDEDKISIRELAYLSLSYDHRIIDGADAAKFLEKLARLIENPVLK